VEKKKELSPWTDVIVIFILSGSQENNSTFVILFILRHLPGCQKQRRQISREGNFKSEF